MTARLIDGIAIGKKIRESVRIKISDFVTKGNRPPCLAVLLIGDDPASQVYVKHKEKACSEAGITSKTFRIPTTATAEDILALIHELNQDRSIDGILPQLPMPAHIDRVKVVSAIYPAKDALRGIYQLCDHALQRE